MKRTLCLLVLLLVADSRECIAQEMKPDAHGAETAPNTGPATEEGKDGKSGEPLHVTIRPARAWERSAAPLAGDPLQNSPVSATVYDRSTIRDAQIEDVEDMVAHTPGMQMSTATNRITLRGAGDLILFTTAQSPVGLYVDDVYIPNPAAFNFDLFDVERIEVLRGPQGFSGGRGSIAGDVRIRTVGARPVNSATIEGALGSFNHRQVRASVNATTEDKLVSNRFAASYVTRDGTVHNRTTDEEIDTRRNWGLRDQLSLKFGPRFTAGLSFDFADFHAVRPAAGGFDSVLDGEVQIFDPPTEKRQLYGGAFRMEWTGERYDFRSITAVRGLAHEAIGSDSSPYNLLDQGFDQSQLSLSEELRFRSRGRADIDWTAGTFFYGHTLDQETLVRLNNAAPPLTLPFGHSETSVADQTLWSAAGFVDTAWHLSDRFKVFGGLRAGYERQTLDYRYVSNDGVAVLAPLQTRDESADFAGLSWKIGSAYDLATGVTPYATISHGFKPGGFNTVQLPGSGGGFDKETVTSYEIGLKSEWFDGSMVANAAAFYFQRENQQVQNIGAFGVPTVNANESRSMGIELTLAGRPVPGLDILFSYAYTDATFEDFPDFPVPGGGTSDLSGRRIPFTSRHSLSAGLQYVHPITDSMRLVVRSDFAYRTALYFDPSNTLRQPGYGIWNARVGLQGDNWGIFGWSKNLTDTKYRTTALTDASSGALAVAGDPRTLGVELRYRF